jgi:biofilm PGA synthesis N-glycosyltransferase PgaC
MKADGSLFLILFILLSFIYLILLLMVQVGLGRLKIPHAQPPAQVSVIIAARNEANRIRPCLESLTKIEYPRDKYEIIFVDDHSNDKTAEIIKDFCEAYDNWHLIRLAKKSDELRGKKTALMEGIALAKGELVFTTDADCVVPPNWLQKTVNYFSIDVSMVLGYSPLIHSKKFYFRLLQFDNLFSAIVAAAPAKLGYPFSSVGRNLAYRKNAYEDIGGFKALKKFRSGDDIHLTHRFRYHNNGRIEYCADPETFVETFIPFSNEEVFQQQIRKNSKLFQLAASSMIFMLLIFFYYVLLYTLPVLAPATFILWIALIAIKFLLEFVILFKSAKLFRQTDLIRFIPLMQVIYPLYIIFFSLLGVFQYYHWKK